MFNISKHDYSIYDYISENGDNTKREGKGRQNFPTLGAVYEGYFFENKSNGKGTMNYEDFVIFDGNFLSFILTNLDILKSAFCISYEPHVDIHFYKNQHFGNDKETLRKTDLWREKSRYGYTGRL
jgi:hypothetical protein